MTISINMIWFVVFFLYFFSVRLLSVLRGHSFSSFPPQWPMDSVFERISIPDLIHYIYSCILILLKEPVFPFSMLSVKQGHYWYHFYNVFGMTRSLTGDWTRDLYVVLTQPFQSDGEGLVSVCRQCKKVCQSQIPALVTNLSAILLSFSHILQTDCHIVTSTGITKLTSQLGRRRRLGTSPCSQPERCLWILR